MGFDRAETNSVRIPPEPSADDATDRIGVYKILGVLGKGGMGVVYEGEQQNPRRRVAVKVVRGDRFVDESRLRMFQREVDTLARLKHPNIAGIYEAGRTDGGQHFFAMELVRGKTLDEYIRERPTTSFPAELRFRLALFRKLADAVHYAHQRGVIHRDLTPSNIVVTEEVAREDGLDSTVSTITRQRLPEIKILDFGLARITEGDVAVATMTTEVGVIKGTLPYMSPEQARGNPDAIDIRTDVYALGVILYEMLTGRRPYDVLKRSLVDAVRVICEEPPLSLSQALTGTRRFDPDIETIVHKALEKDADRRYASAEVFSEDVARYLSSQPILARPPSSIYQLRKFARRNKVLVGAAATVFFVLVGGVVISTTQYLRAERARRIATTSLGEAEAVNRFLQEMLGSANPYRSQGKELTVRENLDEAAERVGSAFVDQPLVEAAVRVTIGMTYRNLGNLRAAEDHLEKAVELRSRVLGAEHPRVYDAKLDLAFARQGLGEFDDAVSLYREVVAERKARLGEEHPDTLEAMYGLAYGLWEGGRFEESARLHRRVLEARRRVLGEDDFKTVMSMHNLALPLRDMGRIDEAEALFREGLEVGRRTLGDNNPLTLELMNQLGEVLTWQDRLEESEPLLREALKRRLEVLGEDHWSTVDSLSALGDVHRRRSELAEAESLFRRAVEISERVQSNNRVWATRWLFEILVEQGKIEEARPLWDSWGQLMRAEVGRPEASPAQLNIYAWLLLTVEPEEWRDPVAALAHARRAVASPGGENPEFLDTLALAYFRNGDVAKAIELQQQAIAGLASSSTSRRRTMEAQLAEYRDAARNR